MYRVLDVREYDSIEEGNHFSNGIVHIQKTHYVVAICEDRETDKRIRFEFYPGYMREFSGTTYYCGYIGDYKLIAPGDTIMIEKTSTYDKVVVILNSLLQRVEADIVYD